VGLLVEYLRQEGFSTWGVDLDLPQLRAAHASLPCGHNFFYGDVTELNISIPVQYNAIILLDTMRHVPEPAEARKPWRTVPHHHGGFGESDHAALAEGSA
jgi:2-polyprenyl-3-methyl-5-hydroxy-6-metoxy-1,4-benzoquinol methylase